MNKIAIYPGSFDPITLGHMDIIDRASKIYDELYVVVGINPNKTNSLLTPDQRVKLIEKAIEKYSNVKVLAYSCLTVEIADKLNATAIVKGLRNSIDFDYELTQYIYNHKQRPLLNHLYLISKEEYVDISSTKVRQLINENKPFEHLIPDEIKGLIK